MKYLQYLWIYVRAHKIKYFSPRSVLSLKSQLIKFPSFLVSAGTPAVWINDFHLTFSIVLTAPGREGVISTKLSL